MRKTAAAVLAALLAGSHAAAQTTSTSLGPATSTTLTSTSTTASSSSTTVTPTTTTSVTTICAGDGSGQVEGYDPRECAQEAVDFGDSKEECRQDCCTSDFEDNVDSCDSCGCDAADLDTFKAGWMNANRFYNTCLVEGGNG